MKIMNRILVVFFMSATMAFAEGPVDLTGSWGFVSAIDEGEVADLDELGDYSAIVDAVRWIDVDGNRKTTYFYKVEWVGGQTRVTFSHDVAFKDIEAVAIARKDKGILEICMRDYSPGVEFPERFESTKDNNSKLFRLQHKPQEQK